MIDTVIKLNDDGLVVDIESERPLVWASRTDALDYASAAGISYVPIPVFYALNPTEPGAWVLGTVANESIKIEPGNEPDWLNAEGLAAEETAEDHSRDVPPPDITIPIPPQYCCAYHQALGISPDRIAALQAGGADGPLWRTLNAIKDQVLQSLPSEVHGEEVELEEAPDITVRMALLALPGEYDAAGAPLRFALVAHVPSLLTIEDESEYRNQVDEFKKFGTQIGAVSTLVTPYPIAAQNTWATINPAMTQPQAFSPARGTPVDLPNPSEFFNNRAG